MRFNKVVWILIIGVLLFLLFKNIDYLVAQGYIIECFTSGYSHTVDMPLTNTYSCQNFCGPTSRCAMTGHQCLSDMDCPGCQPSTPVASKQSTDCVPGDNDAGKLTAGLTPQYSSLTSGYGTHKAVISDLPPVENTASVNTWRHAFDEGTYLFNKRYKPTNTKYMQVYPPMYSITGEFIGDGPLPANY